MSDEWREDEAVAAAPVHEGPTAGALLRQARESAGLHVEALAVALKVPVRKLEALEDDRYDLLPDNVFARGLAASVCRTLKIDPQPIMERLPQRVKPRLLGAVDGVNTPFRASSDASPPNLFAQLNRPVFLAVFALLAGALILILLPGIRDNMPPASGVPSGVNIAPLPPTTPMVIPGDAPANAPAAGAPEAATTGGAGASISDTGVSAPAPSLAPSASMAAPPGTSSARPAAAVAAAAAPSSLFTAPAAYPAASGTVVFRAKAQSWVEVTDARGNVALSKVLAPGDVAGASGQTPLRVTVGRAEVTEVQVRGKPFDLVPHSRSDNVARFEVQ